MAEEDKWTEKGITIKVATMDNFKEIKIFLTTYFFPEEPIFSTLKLYEGDGFIDKIYRKYILDLEEIKYGLKDGTSLLAIDINGDIVASRIGCIFDKKTKYEVRSKLISSLPTWLLPKKIKTEIDFMEFVKYGQEMAFKDVPTATKFYNGLSLAVTPEARRLGLGKELIERTNVIAKEKGCSHVYICASSKYSQAIFKKLNFEVLHEAEYGGFNGRHEGDHKVFKDLKEHKVCQIVSFDLSNLYIRLPK